MPGRDPGGAIITILIGIAGSVIGGFIGKLCLAMAALSMTVATLAGLVVATFWHIAEPIQTKG